MKLLFMQLFCPTLISAFLNLNIPLRALFEKKRTVQQMLIMKNLVKILPSKYLTSQEMRS